MEIKDYIKNEEAYLINLRRYFHEHPEESLKEFNTCKKIEEELDKYGIEHRRVGETGVYAWINGSGTGEQRIIALRSDIDALKMKDLKNVEYKSQNEGYCHACGHDGTGHRPRHRRAVQRSAAGSEDHRLERSYGRI